MSATLQAGRLRGAWLLDSTVPPRETILENSREMDRFLAGVERRAYRMAEISIRDSDEALDIVQEAMIQLVQRYSSRPENEWAPLFYRILQNRIRDYQRRQRVRNRVIGWLPTFGDNPEDQPDPVQSAPDPAGVLPERGVAMQDALGALEEALQALPDRQREAFILRTLQGLDVADTATAMGCSEGSVKTHLSRAVHRLRDELGEHWT